MQAEEVTSNMKTAGSVNSAIIVITTICEHLWTVTASIMTGIQPEKMQL